MQKLTDQTQPDDILQSDNGQDGQANPQRRSHVQTEPEESLVSGVDGAGVGVGALEDPVGVTRCGVDFVPPAQPDESATGDVLEVVKVRGEEQEVDDEDEDAGRRGTFPVRDIYYNTETLGLVTAQLLTHKSLMKRTPNRYIRRLPRL